MGGGDSGEDGGGGSPRIAGPDGGTEENPVGLVDSTCYLREQGTVERFQFKGNREKIREQTVVKALDLLRRSILKNY